MVTRLSQQRPSSPPLQAAKDGDGDEDGEPQQPLFDLSKLQASADGKQADFETRKRARLVTEDFQSDKGERWSAFSLHTPSEGSIGGRVGCFATLAS